MFDSMLVILSQVEKENLEQRFKDRHTQRSMFRSSNDGQGVNLRSIIRNLRSIRVFRRQGTPTIQASRQMVPE